MTMPTPDELETFWRANAMCRALAQHALDLISDLTGDFYHGPPLKDARLERFRQAMRRTYAETFPDKVAKPPPTLTVVN